MQNLKFVSQKLRNAMSFKTNTENSEKGITMKTTQNKLTTALLTTSTLMVLGTTALFAEPKVFYFNGMNTEIEDAKDERNAIRKAVWETHPDLIGKFNPILMYTETFGKIADALRIKFLRYKLISYVNDPKGFTTQYRRCTRPYGCKKASPSQLEFARITKYLIYSGALKDNGAGINDLPYFPKNGKTMFISYSRGNVFANILQENYNLNKINVVPRINIASAGYNLFGKLITSKSDTVIGTYTFRDRNYKPDYYYYNLGRNSKKRFNDNKKYPGYGEKYTWREIYNYYFFFQETSSRDIKKTQNNLDSALAGHSLVNCYLNRKYGLYNDITKFIAKDFHFLENGGRLRETMKKGEIPNNGGGGSW